MEKKLEIIINGAEIGELRISHGEIAFVLTCDSDLITPESLDILMNAAGSDESIFFVRFEDANLDENI